MVWAVACQQAKIHFFFLFFWIFLAWVTAIFAELTLTLPNRKTCLTLAVLLRVIEAQVSRIAFRLSVALWVVRITISRSTCWDRAPPPVLHTPQFSMSGGKSVLKQPLQLSGRVPVTVNASKLRVTLGLAFRRACLQWSVRGKDRLTPSEFRPTLDECEEKLEEFRKTLDKLGWTPVELWLVLGRRRWMPDKLRRLSDGFGEISAKGDTVPDDVLIKGRSILFRIL